MPLWRGLGPGRLALLLVAALVGLGYTPATLTNSAASMLSSSGQLVWHGIRLAPTPPTPLKAAILNVTTDFDELAHLVGDFFRQPGVAPELEQQFKEFLTQRAQRSYPRLESTLDWLLAAYKFAFPFLIISMVARLSGGGAEEQQPQQEVAGGLRREGSPPGGRPQPAVGASARGDQQQALALPRSSSSVVRRRGGSLSPPAAPGTPSETGGALLPHPAAAAAGLGPKGYDHNGQGDKPRHHVDEI